MAKETTKTTEKKTQSKKTQKKAQSKKTDIILDPNISLNNFLRVNDATVDDCNCVCNNRKQIHVNYVYEPLMGVEQNSDLYNEILKNIPNYAHDGDIGMDIIATDVEYDVEYDRYIYHTGFYAETLKKGTGCFIMPRSSNSKTEVYLCNGVGLVDSFLYRGEFCLMFKNREPIGQMVLNLLIMGWLQMPWYKKIFTTFNKYQAKHIDLIQQVCIDAALNDAPYEEGDKIGQLVWMDFPEVIMNRLDNRDQLTETERGTGGFGSTGK